MLRSVNHFKRASLPENVRCRSLSLQRQQPGSNILCKEHAVFLVSEALAASRCFMQTMTGRHQRHWCRCAAYIKTFRPFAGWRIPANKRCSAPKLPYSAVKLTESSPFCSSPFVSPLMKLSVVVADLATKVTENLRQTSLVDPSPALLVAASTFFDPT